MWSIVKVCLMLFLLLTLSSCSKQKLSSTTEYHVSPSGSPTGKGTKSDPWDLTTANARLHAGDTAILHGGDYSVPIKPANSGTEEGRIVYIAAEGETPHFPNLDVPVDVRDTSYITIDGISTTDNLYWVLANGADHLTIRNCSFGNPNRLIEWRSSDFRDVGDYLHLDHNTFYRGDDSVTVKGGSHHLIENNTFDTASHTSLVLFGVHHSVIRRNYFINPTQKHMTIFNTWENIWDEDGRKSEYLVIEENEFALSRAADPDMGWSGIQYAGNNSIIRRNIFYDTGLAIDVTVYEDEGRESWYCAHNRIYNNVFYHNGYQTNPGGDSNSTGVGFNPYVDSRRTSKKFQEEYVYEDQIFVNNLFYLNRCMVPGVPASVQVVFDYNSFPRKSAFFNNLFFYTQEGQAIFFIRDAESVYSVDEFERAYPDFAEGNIQDEPQMIDPENGNFALRETSPAIDAGRDLTFAAAAGKGTQIPVQDALYFSDGKGVVEPDIIRVNGQRATIIRVDYERNVLEVSKPLTWEAGDPVTLDYVGSAPDIGAFEYAYEKTDIYLKLAIALLSLFLVVGIALILKNVRMAKRIQA